MLLVHRAGDKESLDVRAPELLQVQKLLRGFHAFRDDFKAQSAAQCQRGLDNRGSPGVLVHGLYEAAIDLDQVEGKAVQVGKAGMAGAKVIDGEIHAQRLDLPHDGQYLLIILKQGDRKSTRLNSSHSQISYAVFCLKKKKK